MDVEPELITASGIERALTCLGSAVLPPDAALAAAPDADAERGSALHKFVEQIGAGEPVWQALRDAPPALRPLCSAINLDALPRGRPEVAFAFDVRTGAVRELGSRIGREYRKFGATAWDICGTTDIASQTADGYPYAVDLKAGHQPVTAARANPQLLFQAVCMRRLARADHAAGAIVRLGVDGQLWVDRAEFDALALDTFEYQLISLHQTRARAWAAYRTRVLLPQLVPHDGCGYCAGRARCPEFGAALARMHDPDTGGWLAELRAALGTPAGVARAYGALERGKQVLALLDGALRDALATHGEAALPDGRVLALRPVDVRQIDGPIALEVLRARGEDPSRVVRAVTHVTSQEALRKAFGPKRVAELVAAIDAAGGVTVRTDQKMLAARPLDKKGSDNPDE